MDQPKERAGYEYERVFQKFCLGLQNWCRTGKEPQAGDQDMKYYLDLQEKRLKDHGLTLELDMQPEQEIIPVHKMSNYIPIIGSGLSKFNKSLYLRDMTRTVSFFKEGERVFRKKEYLSMYQTILKPDGADPHIGKASYVCPNCGSISTIEVLQDTGCPYCGTRYLMKDLYPKVTNYYFINHGTITDKKHKTIKGRILAAAVAVSALQGVYTFLTDKEFELLWLILGFLLGVVVWSFMIYLVYSFGLMIWTMGRAGKALTMVGATAGSKAKITQKLKACDPAFDYEYFEGKALSLARILMFSPEPENCAQYQGPPLADLFSDIVDVQYRGGIGVRGIRKNKDRIEVKLNLFLTNTLDNGGKIRQKDERIQIDMYHNAAFPVDEAFSIVKVQCPHCGGSFDAAKEKNCPYCGQTYDPGINDWVVTKITR